MVPVPGGHRDLRRKRAQAETVLVVHLRCSRPRAQHASRKNTYLSLVWLLNSPVGEDWQCHRTEEQSLILACESSSGAHSPWPSPWLGLGDPRVVGFPRSVLQSKGSSRRTQLCKAVAANRSGSRHQCPVNTYCKMSA